MGGYDSLVVMDGLTEVFLLYMDRLLINDGT